MLIANALNYSNYARYFKLSLSTNCKEYTVIFARVGGLSPVKHKWKSKKASIHFPPPSKKGIYAFVWPYIEPFMFMWDARNKKELKINGIRKFEYNGPLWCHFDSKELTKPKRGWFYTNTSNLNSSTLKRIRKEDRGIIMKASFLFVRDPYKRGSSGGFTVARDLLEVYIEKKYLGKIR